MVHKHDILYWYSYQCVPGVNRLIKLIDDETIKNPRFINKLVNSMHHELKQLHKFDVSNDTDAKYVNKLSTLLQYNYMGKAFGRYGITKSNEIYYQLSYHGNVERAVKLDKIDVLNQEIYKSLKGVIKHVVQYHRNEINNIE